MYDNIQCLSRSPDRSQNRYFDRILKEKKTRSHIKICKTEMYMITVDNLDIFLRCPCYQEEEKPRSEWEAHQMEDLNEPEFHENDVLASMRLIQKHSRAHLEQ